MQCHVVTICIMDNSLQMCWSFQMKLWLQSCGVATETISWRLTFIHDISKSIFMSFESFTQSLLPLHSTPLHICPFTISKIYFWCGSRIGYSQFSHSRLLHGVKHFTILSRAKQLGSGCRHFTYRLIQRHGHPPYHCWPPEVQLLQAQWNYRRVHALFHVPYCFALLRRDIGDTVLFLLLLPVFLISSRGCGLDPAAATSCWDWAVELFYTTMQGTCSLLSPFNDRQGIRRKGHRRTSRNAVGFILHNHRLWKGEVQRLWEERSMTPSQRSFLTKGFSEAVQQSSWRNTYCW